MSWLSGYKSKPSTSDPDKPPASQIREEKRLKLEAERKHRAEQREKSRKQLKAAQEAREEANLAYQQFLAIAPDVFEGDITDEVPEEDILDDSSNDIMADFMTENGEDAEKAMDKLSSVVCPFDKDDLEFWFSELEGQLELIGVKSQWLKRLALQRMLPLEVKSEVKSLFRLCKADAGDDIYKRIKTELLNLFGKKPEDDYIRAKNRVMTGNPSKLGKEILDDICDKSTKLDGCCCSKTVWAMFRENIPVVIRNHVAEMPFNKDTYSKVFATADKIHASNQGPDPPGVGRPTVAAVKPAPATSTAQPEVAASAPRRNKPPRSQNQGNRGGASASNTTSTAPSSTKAQSGPKENKGPRHATAKGDKLCKIHHRWGTNATFCAAPWHCEMKNVYRAPQ